MAAPRNEDIKGKILESAASLLQERSFNDISISDIAKAAGITKGSVYYYYNCKEDILYDIADGYLQLLYDDLMVWLSDKRKDTSLIRLLKYSFQRGVSDPGKSLRLHLTVEAISGNERLREKLINRYRQFHSVLAEKLRERMPGEDCDYYAWLVIVTIDGLMIQSLLQDPEIDIDRFIGKMVDELTD